MVFPTRPTGLSWKGIFLAGVVALTPCFQALADDVPGKQATGQTGPDGSFQLTTRTTNDGALPGEYRVIVQYEEGTEVPPATNMRDAKAGARKAQQKAAPKYVIPAIYTDPTKTVLKQKVPTEGTVKLELQSK